MITLDAVCTNLTAIGEAGTICIIEDRGGGYRPFRFNSSFNSRSEMFFRTQRLCRCHSSSISSSARLPFWPFDCICRNSAKARSRLDSTSSFESEGVLTRSVYFHPNPCTILWKKERSVLGMFIVTSLMTVVFATITKEGKKYFVSTNLFRNFAPSFPRRRSPSRVRMSSGHPSG